MTSCQQLVHVTILQDQCYIKMLNHLFRYLDNHVEYNDALANRKFNILYHLVFLVFFLKITNSIMCLALQGLETQISLICI